MAGMGVRDLSVVTITAGAHNPVLVRVTHIPTGAVVEKTGRNVAAIRRELIQELATIIKALDNHIQPDSKEG